MSTEKEDSRDMFLSIALIVARAYDRGGVEGLRRIGVELATEEDVRRIAGMEMRDAAELTPPSPPFLILFMRESLDILWRVMDRRREEQAEQEILIRAGACLPLLAAEYGMTGEDYATLRRCLGITSNGRPPLLSEQQEIHLHAIWAANKDKPSSQRWLALAHAGIPLASAWASIQKERAETAAVLEGTEEDEQTAPTSGT